MTGILKFEMIVNLALKASPLVTGAFPYSS